MTDQFDDKISSVKIEDALSSVTRESQNSPNLHTVTQTEERSEFRPSDGNLTNDQHYANQYQKQMKNFADTLRESMGNIIVNQKGEKL